MAKPVVIGLLEFADKEIRNHDAYVPESIDIGKK